MRNGFLSTYKVVYKSETITLYIKKERKETWTMVEYMKQPLLSSFDNIRTHDHRFVIYAQNSLHVLQPIPTYQTPPFACISSHSVPSIRLTIYQARVLTLQTLYRLKTIVCRLIWNRVRTLREGISITCMASAWLSPHLVIRPTPGLSANV